MTTAKKLNWKKSANASDRFEAKVEMTLVGTPSEKVFTNTNGTQYRVCTAKVAELDKQITAVIYEKNYQHGVEEGTAYSGTVSVTVGKDGKVKVDENGNYAIFAQMSHLPTNSRLTLEDINFSFEDVVVDEQQAAFQALVK